MIWNNKPLISYNTLNVTILYKYMWFLKCWSRSSWYKILINVLILLISLFLWIKSWDAVQALIIYSCLPKWTTLFTLIWNLYFLWRYIELVLILAWQTLGYWWLALSGERLPVRVTLTLASWGEATGTTATSGSREQEQTHPKLKYVRSQICVTPLTN